ncbi:hypothetical protein [Burkholderia ubonensis]|uniref:hypothetical protein n=1 Tax=Burkholderia ubonensis TaxID=101571 RepID=UPI000B1E84FE|nr:hypothetical protein [Burkholderia ubonensis]
MNNRRSIPPIAGVVSARPTTVGHTMIFGTTAAGKTFYDMLRLTVDECRIVRGDSPGDARNAGDEACA